MTGGMVLELVHVTLFRYLGLLAPRQGLKRAMEFYDIMNLLRRYLQASSGRERIGKFAPVSHSHVEHTMQMCWEARSTPH